MKLSQELYIDRQGVVHLRGFIVIPTLTRKFRVETKDGWFHKEFDNQVEACQYILKETK